MADNWSDKNSNGYYQSGNLLGILAERQADVMAAALQLFPDRTDITDTIHMTYPFRTGFIFRYSGNFGKLEISFLTPFIDMVWYAFLLVNTLVVIIIWYILLYENKYHIARFKWNFSDTFLSVWGAWCQMGTHVQPLTHASRLVYYTLFLNSLVMYNFYTSSIVSSLLSYRSRSFTIPDLADSPLVCGSVDAGYVHYHLFDTPQYPNMKYFNSKKLHPNFYMSVEEGLQKVREEDFAYHAEFNNMYNGIANTFDPIQICELQEVDTIPMNDMGIYAMKNSPYTEIFRVGLQKIRETGQLHRLLQKWVSKKPVCQANKGVSEVNLRQLYSFFIILFIGMLISTILFIFEIRKKRKEIQSKISVKLKRSMKKLKKPKPFKEKRYYFE